MAVQQLKEKLAQKEKELQLAGTFGKQLLQQSEANNVTIQGLQNENEDLKAELEAMKEKMGTFASLGLDQAMQKLKDEVARAEKQIQAEKERYNALQEEKRELVVKEEVLRSQLREAEAFTASLQNASGSLKESQEQLRRNEGMMEKMERENRQIREEMEDMKSQKNKAEAEKQALLEEVRAQSNQVKNLSQQKASLEAENCDLKGQLGQSETGHKGQLDRKIEDLREAKMEIERLQGESNQFRDRYITLEKQYLTLAKEIQIVSREKEEIKAFLDEAHRKVKLLQAENEENDAASSLVEELAAFSAHVEEKEEAKKEAQTQEEKNSEEYFYLTVAAVRVGLAMKNPSRPDKVIDSAALFDQCHRARVPFHEWHDWLVRELGKDLGGPAPPPSVPQRVRGGSAIKKEEPTGPSIFHNISKALFD